MNNEPNPGPDPPPRLVERCSYDPSQLIGVPIGMFHCPECGEMVVAGMPHPDYDLIFDTPPIAKAELPGVNTSNKQ